MVLRSLKSFGKVDAESDYGLTEFFLETPSYRRIETQERLVVSGHKGAGKTAISSMLLNRAKTKRWSNFLAAGLDFRNYPWDIHDATCPAGSSDSERYAPLWEFLILVELAKLIVREEADPADPKARRARKKLKRFIKRNWGDTESSVGQILSRATYKLTVQPEAFGFSLFSLSREKVPREQLATSLGNIITWLKRMLETALHRESSYFVLLDDLDGGFRAHEPSTKDRLVGVLVAAREIRIWASTEKLPFVPVVFMRSDIYATLQFTAKNKITAEDLERIAWSDAEAGPASLKRLIDQRIAAAIEYKERDPWSEVFAEELIGGRSLYEFMVSRTHLRPRDMIKLANLCLEQANEDRAERIGARHVEAALPVYSGYLLDELADAAHQSVPDWEEHLMTLRRLGCTTFGEDEFKAEHEHGSSTDTSGHALRDLYRFGAVGYEQGGSIVFAHDSDAGLDAGAMRFEVHPGLWDALGLS